LTAAEASVEVNGPNTEALGYINQVRERARNWPDELSTFPEDVAEGLSKDNLIDLILDDRRLELAFESKRWYDIQRRKLGDIVFKGPNSLEPQPNFDAARDYLMPLPRRDMDINPNLRPQNPGY
ncbi:MAG: RagB/SusD family nutrient uptake outer membrane protein, partial [Cyclobacteriaceae bacterium]